MSEAPHRAVILTLKVEADTREALASALFDLARMVERNELTTGVSGGYDSGYIYELIEGASPTHSEYFANLTKYLEEKRGER